MTCFCISNRSVCHRNFTSMYAWEILRAVFYFILKLKLQSLSAHLISRREAERREGGREGGGVGENEQMEAGLFLWFSVFLLAFLSVVCYLNQSSSKNSVCSGKTRESWFEYILIEVCLLLVPWRTFRSIFFSCSLSHQTSVSFNCFLPPLPSHVFHSCPMAPALRLCPTASASPPSSARTRRPPFTTPPGCSSSRSGSGPASPPSSRRLKSSPQSVPLIFLISPLCHPQISTLLFVPDLRFITFSPRPYFGPIILKVRVAWSPACLCVFVYESCCVLTPCNSPTSNLSWRLMEDFWSNFLEYWLRALLIKQYIIPRHSGRYHDTWVGCCNGG